jgi:hypothetical protein
VTPLDELLADGRLFATPAEAEPILRADERTIRRACAAGAIPGAIKIGVLWRIPVQTLCEMARLPDGSPGNSRAGPTAIGPATATADAPQARQRPGVRHDQSKPQQR